MNPDADKDEISIQGEKIPQITERNPLGDERPSSLISRRDFLRILMISAGMVISGNLPFSKRSPSSEIDNQGTDTEELHDHRLLSIKFFRESIGLHGIPEALLNKDSSVTEWPEGSELRTTNISEKNKAYLDMSIKVLGIMDAKRAKVLIEEIRSDQYSPRNSFDPWERSMNLNEEIESQFAEEEDAIGMLLHEIIGHGTDPNLLGEVKLPFDDFVELHLGYWQAVSQAFEVDGEFFNHPGDLMLRRVQTRLGLDVAIKLYQTHFDDLKKFPNLTQILLEISGKNDVKDIVFNKSVVESLGVWLVSNIQTFNGKDDVLSNFIVSKYSSQLEPALVEIYAEMVRLCLEPDQLRAPNNNLELVRNNSNITDGILRVVRVVSNNPSISLEEVRQSLTANSFAHNQMPDSEITNQETNITTTDPTSSEKISSISEEKVPESDIQINNTEFNESNGDESTQREAKKDLFQEAVNDFYKKGVLPGAVNALSNEQAQILRNYATLVNKLTEDSNFAFLRVDPNLYDHPYMHYWDTEKVVRALSHGVRDRILSAMIESDDISGDEGLFEIIMEYSKTLEDVLTCSGDFRVYQHEVIFSPFKGD